MVVVDVRGRVVRNLISDEERFGFQSIVWDGKNDDGENVSSGVYFYQLRANVDGQSDYNKTKKMVIVR